MYSIIRLRLPEDNLISVLTDMIEIQIKELSPKDVAVVGWSLARTKIPHEAPLFRKLKNSMTWHIMQLANASEMKESNEQGTEEL